MTSAENTGFSIGSVERDTGIGRDTLRIWERRYGFPTPARDAKGERVYDATQIRRLQLIRRLLDQGLRPGRVVSLDEEALRELANRLPETASRTRDVDAAHAQMIALAGGGDVAALNAALEQALAREGMRAFVLGTFAPLIRSIGDLWAGGELEVFEEHLLTRQMARFLEVALSRLGRPAGAPQVLLATLPGEQHTLGLLMVEALMWCKGTATLNLGADVPVDQIIAAVIRSQVTSLALSFSACYPRGPVAGHLAELAGRLPAGVKIWIGGAGVQRLRRLPQSVTRMSLDSI